MDNDKLPPLFRWVYYNDGTSDPPPTPVPEPSQEPKEHRKFDYDKLIAESDGLYRQWWMMWKRAHPEWALFAEQPNEQEVIITPKPKVTLKKLSCMRCNHTWIPRRKELSVQCPKCKSSYWNKDKGTQKEYRHEVQGFNE